jgi:hypothetical protein
LDNIQDIENVICDKQLFENFINTIINGINNDNPITTDTSDIQRILNNIRNIMLQSKKYS